MQSHIQQINAAAEQLRRRTPSHQAFVAIRQYMDNNRVDYYMALDRLGQRLGIKGAVHPAFDEESGQHEGWVAAVQLEENNPLDGQEGEAGVKFFSSYNDCCVYAAKKQIVQLMKVPNLINHLV
ncbi:hypothetical protein [Pontibacter harenae]|uniref:hypothetical protein n=1 Tax=Pontibacter harenae TaxID=2894083 RepID=UPI001E4567A8|nr:hypothetical protein [Pontibacter harenae]MCC9168638.1 hypothetical protein [Pontibacter harenae]